MVDHYFTKRPTSRDDRGMILYRANGMDFKIITSSGIFSKKKVDDGTDLLIRNMEIEKGDSVLDLGCGYGIIGIAASKVNDTRVTLTDINQRAVALAKKNLKRNKVKNAEVIASDLYQEVEEEKFHKILCNLPMSAGLETVYRIIDESFSHLEINGKLQVVVRKGFKRIEERMKIMFGNVKTLDKKSGYRVFSSIKENVEDNSNS